MTFKTLLRRPFIDIVCSAFAGWLVLSISIFTLTGGTIAERLEWLDWWDISTGLVLWPAVFGCFYGSVGGIAIWMLTGRGIPWSWRATAAGLLLGACLFPLPLLLAGEVGHWQSDSDPHSRLQSIYMDLHEVQTPLIVGAILGASIGISLWIVLARHSPHPILTAFAGSVLITLLSTIVFNYYWSSGTPSSAGGGLGSTMYAVGVGGYYFFVVLPGSLLAGAIVGLVYGICHRAYQKPSWINKCG